MEILPGHSFKSKKPSAYKIKKKQAAPNVENLSPTNIRKSSKPQNPAAAINSKRPAPQQILEDFIEISPPKKFDNKENLASLLKNQRKKLQVSKDQFVKPPEQPLAQISPTNTKLLNQKPIIIVPDEPLRKLTKVEQPKALLVTPETKMNIENKKTILPQPPQKIHHIAPSPSLSSSSNMLFRNTAVPTPTLPVLPKFQSEREGLMLNFESFKRNKLRYLPNLQLKEIPFGNHIVPVLPSFLMGGN